MNPCPEEVLSKQETKGNVKVVCRFRPLNESELSTESKSSVKVLDDQKTVLLRNQYDSSAPLTFNYDRVFTPESPQCTVYEMSAKPIVDSVLKGFNGTVLAYGQTCSGKTFTMIGPDTADSYYKGIIPRMIETVFSSIEDSSADIEFTVKVSYCEIYLEKIRDLLQPGKQNLRILEDKLRGIYIEELTEEYVSQDTEVHSLMQLGNKHREVGSTRMNQESSRSHAIFMITIAQNNLSDYSARTGKLVLADLAGSEKIRKTKAQGKRLDEAKKINLSLSTLGLVITSLTDGKSLHIPYRDSKLTRVLQDSLGGNSMTCLIVTCSPALYNEQETLSTLRFGVRAKAIKNRPKINRELTVPELKLLVSQTKGDLLEKHKRIALLESLVVGLGGSLPSLDSNEYAEHQNSKISELAEELADERLRLQEEQELTQSLREELQCEASAKDQALLDNEGLSQQATAFTSKEATLLEGLQDAECLVQRLNREVESLAASVSSLSTQNSTLESQLTAKDKDLALLQFNSSKTKELQKKYNELLQTQDLTTENSVLRTELDTLQQSLAQLEELRIEENCKQKGKLRVLETNTTSLTSIYQQVTAENERLLGKIAQLESKAARKSEAFAKLQASFSQVKENLRLSKQKTSQVSKIKKKIQGGRHPRLASLFSFPD